MIFHGQECDHNEKNCGCGLKQVASLLKERLTLEWQGHFTPKAVCRIKEKNISFRSSLLQLYL